jgi:hypothetical protein
MPVKVAAGFDIDQAAQAKFARMAKIGKTPPTDTQLCSGAT